MIVAAASSESAERANLHDWGNSAAVALSASRISRGLHVSLRRGGLARATKNGRVRRPFQGFGSRRPDKAGFSGVSQAVRLRRRSADSPPRPPRPPRSSSALAGSGTGLGLAATRF